MNAFQPTYRIEQGPPAMSWEEYESILLPQWHNLLHLDGPSSEVEFQTFLELHPCLVPGAYSISTPSGHGPYLGALITQPRLVGRTTRVPDFVWLANDSATFNPVFIEIENPKKRWFTKQAVQHHKLTQAFGQLAEWSEWFSRDGQRTSFFEQLSIPHWMREDRAFEPQFLLIYGRRSEFETTPDLILHRQRFNGENLGSMTFDRLSPKYDCRNFVTVQVKAGQFEVIAVPPTLTLGPNGCERWLHLRGVEEAIGRNELIAEDRKGFLCDRLQYWREWASHSNRGFVSSRDSE